MYFKILCIKLTKHFQKSKNGNSIKSFVLLIRIGNLTFYEKKPIYFLDSQEACLDGEI